jgi:hypothetical protein
VRKHRERRIGTAVLIGNRRVSILRHARRSEAQGHRQPQSCEVQPARGQFPGSGLRLQSQLRVASLACNRLSFAILTEMRTSLERLNESRTERHFRCKEIRTARSPRGCPCKPSRLEGQHMLKAYADEIAGVFRLCENLVNIVAHRRAQLSSCSRV